MLYIVNSRLILWLLIYPDYSLLLLSPYYLRVILLFSYYLYLYGDLYERGEFDILKLFGILTIYHFYYFKKAIIWKRMYISLSPLFSCCWIWTKSNDRSKINGCPQHSHFFYDIHFCVFFSFGNGWSTNRVENSTFRGIAHSIFTFAQFEDIPLVLDGPVVVTFFMPPTMYNNPIVNLFSKCNM